MARSRASRIGRPPCSSRSPGRSASSGTYFPRGTARDASVFVHMSLGLGVILLLVLRLVWRALDPPPPAIRADRFEPWLGLRRQGRASAALRAADRDADPRHRAAIRARPGAAGVRPVRHPLAVGDGSRVLPPDASGCTSSPPTRSSSSRSATPRRPCSTIGRCATARWRACCPGWRSSGASGRGAEACGRGGRATGSRRRQAESGERVAAPAAGCARRPMRWQIAKTRSARFIV